MTALSPLLALDANESGAHQRADVRSNMFVTAVLYGDRGSAPARIRNMSRCGALIEAAVIPPDGARVRLCRGSLEVTGQIVWQSAGRAGIRFDAAVAVNDWLPGGQKPAGQQQVDEMIETCRTRGGPAAAPSSPTVSLAEARRQMVELSDALNLAAGELANDLAITVSHGTALQMIDVTAQKLEKLASLLAEQN